MQNHERRRVPSVPEENWSCRANRFIGDFLCYASCPSTQSPDEPNGVHVVARDPNQPSHFVETPAPVSRIERVGKDALVVSSGGLGGDEPGGLGIQALLLGENLRLGPPNHFPDLYEIESRSHAFNSVPHARGRLLGLPAQYLDTRDSSGWTDDSDFETDSIYDSPIELISYLDMDAQGRTWEIGRLFPSTGPEPITEDCEVSCVDW